MSVGTIVDEAIVLLEGLYVHLPLKRAMYAIDPVRRLRLLQVRIERLKSSKAEQTDDLWFHREMSATLTSVRDLHTMYVLPRPFDTAIAALPFQVEDYFDGDRRRYVVTNVIAGIKWQAPATFISGVEVTHWNGIPISRAVELVGEVNAGSNPEARLARGLARLTIRPLAKALPPDEESVRIQYRRDRTNEPCELIVPWRIFTLATGQKIPPDGSAVRVASAVGVDHDSDLIRYARRAFFGTYPSENDKSGWLSQEKCAIEWPPSEIIDLQTLDKVPEYFQAKRFRFKVGGPEYGYIRLRSFAIPGATSQMTNEEADLAAQGFLDAFVGLLERLPQTGLIIDVRDNPGGTISLGERLLQTLTPRHIQPQTFQFINTLMTLNLAKTFSEYKGWKELIERSMETTAPFSTGVTLDSVEFCNDTGQKYHGPVVLVTNALCYSTTDIFAAGFQDHEIGKVLGIHGCTGAGGANVVEHSWLNQRYKAIKDARLRFSLPVPDWNLKDELPGGADFRVALRRSLRVGKLSGTELEDFGVVPDTRYKMTKNDLLNGNVDLMTTAAKISERDALLSPEGGYREATQRWCLSDNHCPDAQNRAAERAGGWMDVRTSIGSGRFRRNRGPIVGEGGGHSGVQW